MCQVLGVSRSGYYAWVNRVTSPPAGRAAADAVLLEQIRAFLESKTVWHPKGR